MNTMNAMNYEDFVSSKLRTHEPHGIDVDVTSPHVFPFQRDLIRWALRRGRSALFASTGLGKTRCQLTWAQHVSEHTSERVLILAPLAVAAQTVREGVDVGIGVTLCREAADVRDGINITNYDRLHKFGGIDFAGVVLDESSCIKHENSKTLQSLLDRFADTPYRLCATATPSPNDYTELGTHAEFLGVCSRTEMLAEFFCHDGGETQTWRLKGHARKIFWRWVASWAALVRNPRDLGYDGSGYDLPPLNVTQHVLPADQATVRAAGLLFAEEAASLMDRRTARRASIDARIASVVELVKADPENRWILWCELNAEQDALAAAFGDECWSVYGSLDADEKERRIIAFINGDRRVLIGKPSIFGFGLNLQSVARMAFVGVTDSFEAYHQAVRRCWRFGQKRAVDVHVFASEVEGAVVRNLERKQRDAEAMAEELGAETKDAVTAAVRGLVRDTNDYAPSVVKTIPKWLLSEEGTA